MNELELKIKEAQKAYYEGSPIMEDCEFDELWDELCEKFPESKLLQTVGEDSNEFPKMEHFILMGSQNKVNSEEEINDFLKRVKKDVIIQYKEDGISIELVYQKGKLTNAITRGDGRQGFDIYGNVIKMQGVPKQIESSFTGAVRGEILLSKEDKDKYFPEMRNCRNTAAGLSKRLDGKGCEYLTVICYDAQAKEESKGFKTQVELQNWLYSQGFNVARWEFINNVSVEDCMKALNETFENLEAIDFDIDGLVIKQNEIDIEDFKNNLRPKTTVALKPKRTYKTTILRDIQWNCNNGTFTPVAIFDSVNLLGANITKASLGNIDLLLEMGIEIRHTIEVTRCGEIIPKVTKDITTGKFRKGYEH